GTMESKPEFRMSFRSALTDSSLENPHFDQVSRFDNILSWLCASIIVASAVALVLRRADERPREPGPAALTPAQEPLRWQIARAIQHGRGRRASAPSQIPGRGWKDILLRTYHKITKDRVLDLAAGVVFYSLLALFPAIAAGVSSYALFAD